MFEFDPNAPIAGSLTDVTPALAMVDSQAWISRMVVLPTGQVLARIPGADGLFIYTPDGAPNSSWKPTITSVVASGGGAYTLTGTQLTGLTGGAISTASGSGDTSYPLVRLTNAAGTVYHARTFDWSTSAIATGSTPVTTKFTLPSWLPYDNYSLSVVTNGISSDPMPFTAGSVKYYVVDDAATDLTYRYSADGAPSSSSPLAGGNAAPRGVASTIAGDKTWVIDNNKNVYVYSANGEILGSWSAGSMANNATPQGIATNGTDVWIVDSRSDKVFRYAGAANRLSGSQNATSSFLLNGSNSNAKDIVTDGVYLWVVDDGSKNDKVFNYNLAGSLQGSWTIDSANKTPTGITIDPADVSDIWIVDSGTDRVYQYTGAASRTSLWSRQRLEILHQDPHGKQARELRLFL